MGSINPNKTDLQVPGVPPDAPKDAPPPQDPPPDNSAPPDPRAKEMDDKLREGAKKDAKTN